MKKIFLLLAFLATTVLAHGKNLILDNKTNCSYNVTLWSENTSCTGPTCYKYSCPVFIPAASTTNYAGPGAFTWAPTPCMSAPSLTFTAVVLTGGPCGWNFDLGLCTASLTNGPLTCACGVGGTVTATLTITATTIILTLN